MTRLDEALARLERAVARLERVLASDGSGEAGLRAERADEIRRLRDLAGDIAVRVDGALEAIARALGRGEVADG